MKHDVTSLNTKRALANSLKKLMSKKPLSKISISEIVLDCNFNRKTFYYHFEDIYDLLKWMLEEEAIKVVKQFDLLTDYEDAIVFVLNYVNENKHLLSCVYDSIGRDEMKRFFYSDFIGITKNIIENTRKQQNIQIDEEYEEFLAHFYTEAIAGLLIDEFTDKKGHDIKKATKYISHVLSSSLANVLNK